MRSDKNMNNTLNKGRENKKKKKIKKCPGYDSVHTVLKVHKHDSTLPLHNLAPLHTACKKIPFPSTSLIFGIQVAKHKQMEEEPEGGSSRRI